MIKKYEGEYIQTTIYLYGDLLVPDNLSSIMNIAPTYTQSCGDVLVSKSGHTRTSKTGVWCVELGRYEISDSFEQIISDTISLFKNLPSSLIILPGVERALLDIYVSKNSSVISPLSWKLSNIELKKLHDIGVDMQIKFDF